MERIQNQTLDMERAFYGKNDLSLENCTFDGPADGESALKECRNIQTNHCLFNLRYPFWHDSELTIHNCEMTPLCRAALWYSNQIEIRYCKLHGIKALRECQQVQIEQCDIISPEFGWFTQDVRMQDCTVESEYFMLRSARLQFKKVQLNGKYSFQYITDSEFDGCSFQTKDAFWHARNVTIRNSTIKGEYLGWYCENVTFDHCRIIGTQPLCYCKNLKLIDCEMMEADLCFEKSDVQATVTTPVISIKNPASGQILVPQVDEIIRDDPHSLGKIIVGDPATNTIHSNM